MYRRIMCLSVILIAGMFIVSNGQSAVVEPQVSLVTTKGEIVVELDQARAPNTVKNFLEYVNSGFYEGTIFHRVIKGFMIQGGGLTADMNKKKTRDPIKNEATNRLSNRRGTIAMARTGDPHSATAQFFINTVNNDGLDFKNESKSITTALTSKMSRWQAGDTAFSGGLWKGRRWLSPSARVTGSIPSRSCE